MSLLKNALELAKLGFHVFPLQPNSKLPIISDYPTLATRDADQIKKWWTDPVLEIEKPYNIGISTTQFSDSKSLLAVDIDNKNGKRGGEKLLELELEGMEFPDTLTQLTPTGGSHLLYWTDAPVKQGVSVFEEGLDVRGKGGYVVGSGSIIDGKAYKRVLKPLARAPRWMVEKCGQPRLKAQSGGAVPEIINPESAIARATFYLLHDAPISVQGAGGDQTAYRVAARVKDFGVDLDTAWMLMFNYWNDHCSPPWNPDDLAQKVKHAYQYGLDPIGVAAPETQFEAIVEDGKKHPFEELNKEYAFVIAGGGSHILWQTTGPKGEYRLEHLGIQAFHQKLASQVLDLGHGAKKPVSELWIKSKERRSYDGIVFMPGLQAPERFYNLWRGFAVSPVKQISDGSVEAKESLEMFLDHAKVNICANDPFLYKWLIGYFAQLVQRPWEKPLVALVFKGSKGVGKNALVERIGHLLGSHYLLTSNKRYLTGNFNGHLENLCLLVLDEAFWSGDKQAEGTLKDLITGKTHVIEHKGKEPYSVDNCTRVVIIGNEEWLVPASQDERRFAVFDVGEGKKQDRTYFQTMREGMEKGGYELLLRYLLDYDLKGIDLNAAPSTDGLMEQKLKSLDPFMQFWFESLTEGSVVGNDFGSDWPTELDTEHFRNLFRRYLKDRQIRTRIPESRVMGKMLKACLPSIGKGKRTEGTDKTNVYTRINTYKIPDLTQARIEWESFIGHKIKW